MTLTEEQIAEIRREMETDRQMGWKADLALDYIPALLSALEAANKRAAELEEPGVGWLYQNPDTGVEFSRQHPIKSGEVDDAEHVRPATAENLLPLLLEAWAEKERLEGAEVALLRERDTLKARADEAEALVRMLEDAETVEIMQTLRARVAVMQEALEIIAGKRQCLDNLMGNKDVALAALTSEGVKE